MYSIHVIRNWDELRGISQEWDELLERSNSDSIFLTWAWIDAWWRAVGNTVEPFVITVRSRNARLVGICPFYRGTMKIARAMRLRVLRVLGDYATGSNYASWIAIRDESDQVHDAMASYLHEQRNWDCIWLQRVASWTGMLQQICDASGKHDIAVDARPVTFSSFPLPNSFEEYLQTLTRSGRAELKRAARRIFSGVDANLHICSEQVEVSPMLQRLFDLNTKRWAAVGKAGVFQRRPEEARFYEEFVPVALERGWLRLVAIESGQEAFAMEIGYVYKGTFYSVQAGFDPDGPRSAGRALDGKLLETLVAGGVREFDFLCGEASYKTRLGAQLREGHDMLLIRRNMRTLPLRLLKPWPRGRFIEFAEFN